MFTPQLCSAGALRTNKRCITGQKQHIQEAHALAHSLGPWNEWSMHSYHSTWGCVGDRETLLRTLSVKKQTPPGLQLTPGLCVQTWGLKAAQVQKRSESTHSACVCERWVTLSAPPGTTVHQVLGQHTKPTETLFWKQSRHKTNAVVSCFGDCRILMGYSRSRTNGKLWHIFGWPRQNDPRFEMFPRLTLAPREQ